MPFIFPLVATLVHILIRTRANLRCNFPYYSPITSGDKVDYFNPSPAKGSKGEVKYDPADGIAYFGNVYGTNEQAWFSNSMLRQHLAFLATTGSGKTFTISGIGSANALVWGAGYMYVDAKADLSIILMHQTMMWRTNRIDDFFLLNYIRGSRNRNKYATDRTTNTYNLVESGSAAQNTETFKSLMSGDGDIWAKRADSLVAGLMRPTHCLRDLGEIQLSIPALLDYLVLETAGSLLGNELIPEVEKKELMGFIKTLPGMTAEFFQKITRGESVQSPQVYDQWGFAAMQIVVVFNTLGGDYADIFGVIRGEIDIEAIVNQDRVLLGLLPALEGSTESVASMGRIIMASRKGIMGQSLGDVFVGEVKKNLKQRPTNAPYPYINIMDEVGMMFSEGEGAVAAQARGLGYSAWYSAQDIPALKKLGGSIESEVDTVLGNTTIKVAGRIIDDVTFELYSKLADIDYVWQREGMDLDYSESTGAQRQKESRASYKEESRLDRREVSRLREGEIYVNAVDRLHRIDGPNLHPKELETLTINDFWMMLPEPAEELRENVDDWLLLYSEYELITSNKSKLNTIDLSFVQEIGKLSNILSLAETATDNSLSKSMLSFSAFVRDSVEEMRDLGEQHNSYMDSLYAAEPSVVSNDAIEEKPTERVHEVPPVDTREMDVLNDLDFNLPSSSHDESVSDGDHFEVTPTLDGENKGEVVSESKQSDSGVIFTSDVITTEGNVPSSDDASVASLNAQSEDADINDDLNTLLGIGTEADIEQLNALDSIFKAQGTSKEETINSLATISALSLRSEQIQEQLNNEELSSETAIERMNSPVSESELRSHTLKSTSVVNDFYRKTEHPHDPIPQTNKALAISILKKVKLDIQQSIIAKGYIKEEEASEVE